MHPGQLRTIHVIPQSYLLLIDLNLESTRIIVFVSVRLILARCPPGYRFIVAIIDINAQSSQAVGPPVIKTTLTAA